ncbi:transposable element Tcb1 transposase [Trichonephila clavipes]|nr:transposable element Tcb1 transposase [Trichonephila clavipes]
MDCPASSPNFNPVEYAWNILGGRTAARQPPPKRLPELRRPMLDEWCNIHQDQIDNSILSMSRSCAHLAPCHDEFCGPRSDYVKRWH